MLVKEFSAVSLFFPNTLIRLPKKKLKKIIANNEKKKSIKKPICEYQNKKDNTDSKIKLSDI